MSQRSSIDLTPAVQAGLWARLRGVGSALFGPGTPLPPTVRQAPEEGDRPRAWQYPMSGNLVQTPRADLPTLTPMSQLRSLATAYDVAALCIKVLCDEVGTLDWDVVPLAGAPKDAALALAPAITRVKRKLDQPDGDLYFTEWVTMLLREDLEVGAPAVYRNRSKGGDLLTWEIVDGTLIKPLEDVSGHVVGYQQTYQGVALNAWDKTAWWYRPRLRRRGSPYGIAPMELVLLTANRALRRQARDLSYDTDGNIPDVFAGLPESWTPPQIEQFMLMLDVMLTGDDSQRRKIHPWPGKVSEIKEMRQPSLDTVHEDWMMHLTAAAFGVKPSELGFTDKVNRATGDTQQEAQARVGVGPLVVWAERLITTMIQVDLKEPRLRCKYDFGGAKEDAKAKADVDKAYFDMKVYGAFTIRERDGITLAPGDEALTTPPPDPPPLPAPAGAAPGGSSGAAPAMAPPETAPPPAPDAPAGSNVLLLFSHATLTKVRGLNTDLAKLTGAGSRGGHYYIDANGKVHYGVPPVVKPAAAARHAHAAERKATRAERHAALLVRRAAAKARKEARHALVVARANARDELKPLADLHDMTAKGWHNLAPAGYGADRSAANSAAQAAGAKDPHSLFAVVKVNGAYYVVSKPQSALAAPRAAGSVGSGSRAANVTGGGVHHTSESTVQAEAAADPTPAKADAPGDLKKWQEKAIRRLRAGKPAACPFTSPAIDPALVAHVAAALAKATSAAAVRAAFAMPPPPAAAARLPTLDELEAELTTALTAWLTDLRTEMQA